MTKSGKSLFVMLLLAAALPLAAQEDDRYLVRLDPAAAVDRVDAIAMQLAATHGGTIVSTDSPTEDTVVLRIPAARAAALRSDPRVRAVRSLKVAAEAKIVEPVNWTAGVNYTYDGASSVTKIGADEFAYDDVGRVVRAKVNNVTRAYEYDAFGNRKKCTAGATDCQYAIQIDSKNNRLTERTDIDHDDAGNVTRLAAHAYEYDVANMMTKDHSPGGRYEYLYNAGDERLATYNVDSETWTWTLRDHASQVVRELTSDDSGRWAWTRDYVHRDGKLLASRFAADEFVDTHHYHLDHLGTPRRVTDSTDLIVGYHDYHAFGPEVPGSVPEPYAGDRKYTGHEREPHTDEHTLDYMHARFYNPTLGRFLSSDPVITDEAILVPQLWNRYAYVVNDPMSHIDPDGRLLQALDGDAGTARQAFERLQRLVPAAAAGYLNFNSTTGMITLSGISRLAFGKRFGPTAEMIANLITVQDRTATFALANSDFAKKGGGARTEPTDYGTHTEIGPGLIPKMAGGVPQNVETTLAHELGHAFQDMYGLKPGAPGYGKIDSRYLINPHEAFGMWAENRYRAEKKLPPRTYYWYGPKADFGVDYTP